MNLTAAGWQSTSECSPADNCKYGHVGLGLTLGLNVKFELIACVESWWSSKKCAGVEIQPVGVSGTVEGGVAYHEPTCQTGVTGYAKVKDVRVSAVFKLPAIGSKGVTQTLSWDFGGFTIWDSGSGS